MAVYDETVRYNITLIDARLSIVQPYLPGTRGIDSPTFVFERAGDFGLYHTYQRAFEWTQQRAKAL